LQKWFIWDPVHEDCIRRNFENRGNARLKDFLGRVRKHNKKPVWLSDAQWEGLQQHWANEHYKKLYETPQKNRLGTRESGGPSFHTCGSIPMHEHRRRLINELIFAMYLFKFNTVFCVVLNIILSGTYIEGATWDRAHHC